MTSNVFENYQPSDLLSKVEKFCLDASKQSILVIGDIMLDQYIFGEVLRLSREAPIPILKYDNQSFLPGGAANVAINLTAFLANVTLISVAGNDQNKNLLLKQLAEYKNKLKTIIIPSKQKETCLKIRYLANSQQIFRLDKEDKSDYDDVCLQKVIDAALKVLSQHKAVILSDYGNGVVCKKVASSIISAAKKLKIPVFVDPRSHDFSTYAKADYITPNIQELIQASENHSFSQNKSNSQLSEFDYLNSLAMQQAVKNNFNNVLLTRSENGISLFSKNSKSKITATHIRALKTQVFDVTGAGDCVVAWFCLAIACNFDKKDAAFFANLAGSLAVKKLGVAKLSQNDLWQSVNHNLALTSDRISNLTRIKQQVALWKKKGLTIGFTNGCFDILHLGHLSQLSFAKKYCDRLIVALNSDHSVKKIKGKDRPINNQKQRAILLSYLRDVDSVIIFNDDKPLSLIKDIKPDVYVKGSEYKHKKTEEFNLINKQKGKVVFSPMYPDLSSTKIITKIRK